MKELSAKVAFNSYVLGDMETKLAALSVRRFPFLSAIIHLVFLDYLSLCTYLKLVLIMVYFKFEHCNVLRSDNMIVQ